MTLVQGNFLDLVQLAETAEFLLEVTKILLVPFFLQIEHHNGLKLEWKLVFSFDPLVQALILHFFLPEELSSLSQKSDAFPDSLNVLVQLSKLNLSKTVVQKALDTCLLVYEFSRRFAHDQVNQSDLNFVFLHKINTC